MQIWNFQLVMFNIILFIQSWVKPQEPLVTESKQKILLGYTDSTYIKWLNSRQSVKGTEEDTHSLQF